MRKCLCGLILIVWSHPLVAHALPLRVGADQDGANIFTGAIAALRVYERTLTPEEVAALALTRPDAPAAATQPARQWLPGNLTSGAASDTIRHTPARVHGAVEAAMLDGVACAKFGGGFLEVTGDAELVLDGDFTVEAWVRPAAKGMTARIVDQIVPGATSGFLLDVLHGDLRLMGNDQMVKHAWQAPLAGWTHICATAEGGSLRFYVDGKPAGQTVSDVPRMHFAGTAPAPASPLVLWWKRPGTTWNEAMVLGNGRLGAMVSGGVAEENIWLNDDTLWSGENSQSASSTASAAFPKIRQLLLDRDEPAANALYPQLFGPYNQTYLPLGNLRLSLPTTASQVRDYQRRLDLATGIATVTYNLDGVTYTREMFVSYPDQALVLRLTADQPGKISFAAKLSSLLRHEVTASGAILRMTGRCPSRANPDYAGGKLTYDDGPNPKGMRFAATLQATPQGGQISATDGQLAAVNCDSVTLRLVAATSFNGFDKSPSREGKDPVALCDGQLAGSNNPDFTQLQTRHTADFRALMGRVRLEVPQTASAKRPINERVGNGFQADDLQALTALYYQFGRYLLVSSSRPGSQPANLQGIWNDSTAPGWSSNWTMNCNANFNYLGVEAANLSELHEPFIRMIREWSVDGARVAKSWYGCRGWVGHHNIDLWRNAAPVSGNPVWAAFICGGAWACQDLWEHYAFSRDPAYLAEIWPTLRGSAEFFLDLMVKDPKTGYLVTVADTNFENGYTRGALCLAPTPSNMMVRQLFINCIAASELLKTDAGLRAKLEAALPQLPPTVVSPGDGEIQEYLDPTYKISDRPVSELLSTWGLIWSDQVSPRKTPDLAAAMRKAYEAPDRRPWVSGEVHSWQGAFPANTFARLGDGQRAGEILATHFRRVPYPNLSASFRGFWEIDGNLGTMAAIGEMLMQSQSGEIELLPALPTSWPNGSVSGLRARGDFTVDFTWAGGQVTRYRIQAGPHASTANVKLRVNGQLKEISAQLTNP